MDKFEALWAYQEEDMKADAISAAIRRSPTRQKLEKARDFILERQKQYKQIEEDIAAMVDRKDIIAQAIARSREQLQALQARLENELASETAKFNEALRDSLNNFLKAYNKDKKYDIILSKAGDNILFADKKYDITQDIINGLNKRYKPAAKKADDKKSEDKKDEKK